MMPASEAKRVLFVAYYFPPRGGAGVQRSLKFVKYLRRFGWEPTVLTCPYENRRAAYDDSLLAEVPEGTAVVRVPSNEQFFIRLSRAGLGRLTSFLVRPDSCAPWARRALEVARGLHEQKPFDAVYTSLQPWGAGLVGLNMSRSAGLPWVCDYRDPWVRSMHLVWPTRMHWKKDFALERQYVTAAARTVTATETMRELMLADHPMLDSRRIVAIDNGYDEEDVETAAAVSDDGKFTIVFAGKFQHDWRERRRRFDPWGRFRALGTYGRRDVVLDTHSPIYFFEALARFLRRAPEKRKNIRVVLAGQTGKGNEALAAKLGLADVTEFKGYVPHADALALVASADALLLPMFSTENPCERVPYASGKIFEYMAARRPILALTQAGDARDLALRSGLAVAAPPRDVAGIEKAVEMLYENWQSGEDRLRPNEEFIASFTRERLAARLAAVLEEAVREPGVPE